MTVLGDWIDYNFARVSLPRNETDWYPQIIYTNQLHVTFYGFGDMYYNQKSIIKSNGNINLWINTLSNDDTTWGNPVSIQSNIPNMCSRLSKIGEDVVVCGTYIITLNDTNGFIKRFSNV
jgi:hypothetical protein